MAKLSKRTKKFQKKSLSGEIQRRKARQKVARGQRQKQAAHREPAKASSSADAPAERKNVAKQDISSLDAESFMEEAFFRELDSGDASSPHDIDDEDDAVSGEEGEEEKSGEQEVDDDGEEEEEAEEEVRRHRAELAALRDTDPEFVQFLEQNDRSLLDFADDDDDDDGQQQEDDDADDDDKLDAEDDGDEAAASDDEEPSVGESAGVAGAGRGQQGGPPPPPSRGVSLTQLDDWQRAAVAGSGKAQQRLLAVLRTACHLSDDEPPPTRYRLESGAVFDAVLRRTLPIWPSIWRRSLTQQANTKQKQKSEQQQQQQQQQRQQLPQQEAGWGRVADSVRSVLGNVVHWFEHTADPALHAAVLRQLEPAGFVPFVASSGRLGRRFLRRLLQWWAAAAAPGTPDEHCRLLSFLLIRALALAAPATYLPVCLKGVYLTYVRQCKFYSPQTAAAVSLLRNGVVELYSLHAPLAYQHAFVYIRQLAIHLRNAVNVATKASQASVLNWQFVNSLRCWLDVVASSVAAEAAGPSSSSSSAAAPSSPLRPLLYPLVQLVFGLIRLQPSARYFPLRFICVDMLLPLAARCAPLLLNPLPYVLDALLSPEMAAKPRPGGAALTAADTVGFSLKVAKALVGTRGFQQLVVDRVHRLLLTALAAQADSLAFPELVLPAVVALRRWLKHCRVPQFKHRFSQLLDAIAANAKFVSARRQQLPLQSLTPHPGRVARQQLQDVTSAAASAAVLPLGPDQQQPPLRAYFEQFVKRWAVDEQARPYDRRRDVQRDEENDDDEEEEEEEADEDDEEQEEKQRPRLPQQRPAPTQKQQRHPPSRDRPTPKGLKPVAKKHKHAPAAGQDEVTDFELADF